MDGQLKGDAYEYGRLEVDVESLGKMQITGPCIGIR